MITSSSSWQSDRFPIAWPHLMETRAWPGFGCIKDDLTRERCLGAIAAMDPGIISIEAVEEYLLDRTKDAHRARAARESYESTLLRVKVVTPDQGIEWPYEIPVLPKWHEFQEGGVVVPAIPRGFKMGPQGQNRICATKTPPLASRHARFLAYAVTCTSRPATSTTKTVCC